MSNTTAEPKTCCIIWIINISDYNKQNSTVDGLTQSQVISCLSQVQYPYSLKKWVGNPGPFHPVVAPSLRLSGSFISRKVDWKRVDEWKFSRSTLWSDSQSVGQHSVTWLCVSCQERADTGELQQPAGTLSQFFPQLHHLRWMTLMQRVFQCTYSFYHYSHPATSALPLWHFILTNLDLLFPQPQCVIPCQHPASSSR
jgi:hypothetical protein